MWWSSVASAASTFMPPEATAVAVHVNDLYGFMLITSFISFVILIGGMIYFVFKYRRRSGSDKTAYITHNHTLEFIWSFVPFCLFMFVFAWGWMVYHKMRSFPDNALEVHVVAKKWDWRFIYKNGKEVTSTLNDKNEKVPPTMVVPVGRPVKLIMASERINPAVPIEQAQTDRAVLHSFYIPAFRIKQDVVPGRYTAEWFQADKEGEYWVFCAEYCGASHYDMRGRIKVVSSEEFDKWLAGENAVGNLSLADQGRELYAQKACIGCHTLTGAPGVGPTWKGLWSKTESTDKGAIKVDEAYLRESILEPNAKITTGFSAGIMPAFGGQLSDDQVRALIEFIKTVK
jgi:cytochrome c oxidase subunit 2